MAHLYKQYLSATIGKKHITLGEFFKQQTKKFFISTIIRLFLFNIFQKITILQHYTNFNEISIANTSLIFPNEKLCKDVITIPHLQMVENSVDKERNR